MSHWLPSRSFLTFSALFLGFLSPALGLEFGSNWLPAKVSDLHLALRDGLVSLGSTENKIEAGQQVLAKPTLDGNGMYPLVASYLDADVKTVSYYDRLVSGNPNSLNMLFLLPDEAAGLRLLSFTIFGELT